MDIKQKKELPFIPKDEMEDYRRKNLAERTFLSGYSQEKYEEILNIFLEIIKDENYKNVISKDEKVVMRSINIDSHDGLFSGNLIVMLDDNSKLNILMKKLRTIKGVKEVVRI